LLRGRKADVDVGAQWSGYVLAQQGADRAARYPAQDLAEGESERIDVITMRGAGLPPRNLLGDGAGHHGPVQHRAGRQPAPDGRDPGLVAEELPHGHRLLATGPELRPVPGDGRIGVEQAGPGQPGGEHRHQSFADGEEVDQRVGSPRPDPRGRCPAAPQIGDDPPARGDPDRGAGLAAHGEILGESAADRLEAGVAGPVDHGAASLAAT
jgi:hypothetical protein